MASSQCRPHTHTHSMIFSGSGRKDILCKSHRSPLHKLGLLIGIDPGQLETLDPVRHLLTHKLKAKISVGGPSEDAVAEELNNTNSAEIQLYLDGSVMTRSTPGPDPVPASARPRTDPRRFIANALHVASRHVTRSRRAHPHDARTRHGTHGP